MKKLRKHKLRQSSLECIGIPSTSVEDGGDDNANDGVNGGGGGSEHKKQRRRSKCTDEFCKHRKHKKRRKHKKHHHSKEGGASAAEEESKRHSAVTSPGPTDAKALSSALLLQPTATEKEDVPKSSENDDTETMDSFSVLDDPDFKAGPAKRRLCGGSQVCVYS